MARYSRWEIDEAVERDQLARAAHSSSFIAASPPRRESS